jgi:hypothetical protein
MIPSVQRQYLWFNQTIPSVQSNDTFGSTIRLFVINALLFLGRLKKGCNVFHATIIVEFFGSSPWMSTKRYPLFETLSVIDAIDMLNIQLHVLFSTLHPWNHHGLKSGSIHGGTNMSPKLLQVGATHQQSLFYVVIMGIQGRVTTDAILGPGIDATTPLPRIYFFNLSAKQCEIDISMALSVKIS